MNLHKTFFRILGLLTGLATLAIAPVAFAIDPSVLVQEGNTNCNDYGDNKTIKSLAIGSPILTATSESPATAGNGDIQLKYWIEIDTETGDQVLKFREVEDITGTPATPEGINIVILKGDQNKAQTFSWGNDEGVSQWPPLIGSSVKLAVSEPQTSIEAVTFCYGLGLGEELVITLPACGGVDIATGNTGDHYDTCELDSGGIPTSDFECDIVNGELECCSCLGELTGVVLGGDAAVDFSFIDGSVVGEGSPSRYCRRTSTGYICFYCDPVVQTCPTR